MSNAFDVWKRDGCARQVDAIGRGGITTRSLHTVA